MSWLRRLFGLEKESPSVPAPPVPDPLLHFWKIPFGRYSDNNKSYGQIQKWYQAEACFQKKDYECTLELFLGHLQDEPAGNVIFEKENKTVQFELLQGSAKITAVADKQNFTARANLAGMPSLSVPAMNRMLQRNFNLRYARFAMDEADKLCMLLEIPTNLASPNRLYYGLRELALNADQFAGALTTDFSNLKELGEIVPIPIPENEVKVKYAYFRQWITDALVETTELSADTFSGAIAYLLLTALYRIEFLIAPEGRLQQRLDEIGELYWKKKEERPLVSRNARVAEGLRSLLDISEPEFAQSLKRSRRTFSEKAPPPRNKVAENIRNANQDSEWYVVNQYPQIAQSIIEYGILYSLYSFSVPSIITQLSTLFLYTQHPAFFHELGIDAPLFNPETGRVSPRQFDAAVQSILREWSEKYPQLRWDQSRILFDNPIDFARTFTEQIATLNLEIRR
jgi:hypothetical protein